MSPEDYVIEAFTCGDCWALALELKARFPHLTVCTLIDPYWAGEDDPEVYDFMQWSHVVVLDKTTGIYYDVLGKHDPAHGFPDWEMFEWEEIYEIPDEDLDEYFSDQWDSYPTDYTTGEGAEMMEHGVTLATVDIPKVTAVA